MWKRILFTLGGALLGAVVGHFLFSYLVRNHGAFGYAIPGALVAFGASLNKQCPARWMAILCGVIAFFAGNFSLWKFRPWVADESFGYALTKFFDRDPMAWILILLASAIAIWMPWRRSPQRIK
ncbi:hypothetical protein OAM04_00850 [bacterium]|nr:hypothetical protein [Verrucomicrobiales bacterium]MDC0311749.1 hypothetical protein [bacterium]